MPTDHSFLTGAGENRVLKRGQLSGQQRAEKCFELAVCSWRQACLEPIAAQQLALFPSQHCTTFAIDQGDSRYQIKPQQDHVGNIEVSLGAIAFVTNQLVSTFTFGDVLQQAGHPLYSARPTDWKIRYEQASLA